MPDSWQLAAALARFLLYLGVLGSAGLVFAHIVLRRETGRVYGILRRQAAALAVLALAAAGLGFLLTGAAMTGDASGMADAEMLGLLWRTPAGTALATQAAGLVLLLGGALLPGRGVWVSGAGGLIALWAFCRVGHVADAGAAWLQAVLLVHLAAAAFWIGIFTPLSRLAADDLPAAAALGTRFGRIAVCTVPLLIAAGIVMAWRLLGDFSALVTTAYGLALLAKVAGVGVLLAAGAANKLRFVPAMRRGERAGAQSLRRSIAVEWLAVAAVLLLTAALTGLAGLPG
ncbi:MAG: CopD family protein [Defluviicoccus sp.]|nr:CopD family protein [Defluviicoccus sp.]MDE0383456.1 CopD family protein [Defluviicoccus sp.]